MLGQFDATARGSLGWRHAFGNTEPLAIHASIVAGVPIMRDAALIEAGLDISITKNANLALSYQGYAAEQAVEHGLKVTLEVKF